MNEDVALLRYAGCSEDTQRLDIPSEPRRDWLPMRVETDRRPAQNFQEGAEPISGQVADRRGRGEPSKCDIDMEPSEELSMPTFLHKIPSKRIGVQCAMSRIHYP